MKKDILKIAGVKSENEFYRKYPDEASFMKVHKKEFKKAAMGASMVKKQLTQLTDFSNPPQAEMGDYIGGDRSNYKPLEFSNYYNQVDRSVTGMDQDMRMKQMNLEAQQKQAENAGNKGGFDLGNLMQAAGSFAQIAESLRQGGYIPRAQDGLISMPDFTKADKTINRQFKYDNSKFNQGMQKFGKDIGKGYDKLDSSLRKIGGVAGAFGVGQDLLQGFQELKQEKQQKQQANKFSQLSGVVKQAASSRPEETQRRYVRPEDNIVNPGQISSPYGTGGDFLQMAYGGSIGGNSTEIQNMYNPGDIYSDMGYEPLSDSDIVKQYRRGGFIPRAQFGIDKMAGQAGGALGSLIGGNKGRPTAGGKIGSTIGSTVGKFIPIPGAPIILGAVGGIVGGVLGGKSARQTTDLQEKGQSNLEAAAFQNAGQNIQSQYSGFMEDGGEVGLKYLSHDFQPQVITQFGGYDMNDLLRADPTMDTLRAGGHLKNYTSPNKQAMETYAMGGELETHWGGNAEPISYNPYLPDGGETVMFRGQSHDESDGKGRTGIGITYGENPVEVERGEPAVKLQDGGEAESLVVYGNMMIPSYGVSELGDPLAKGKKFKNYANDLSKMEVKQNKIVEKGLKLIESADENNPFDLLKLNSGQAMMMGANESLKGLAIQKQRLAGIQTAILDTAEEMGVDSDALSKGIIKQVKNLDVAKFGGKFTQAQDGRKIIDIPLIRDQYGNPIYNQPIYESTPPEVVVNNKKAPINNKRAISNKKSAAAPSPIETSAITSTPYTSSLDSRWDKYLPEKAPNIPVPYSSLEASKKSKIASKVADKIISSTKDTKKKDRFGLDDALRRAQPYLIPSNQEPFDPSQLSPEMFALATNQLEPVQAQTFQPMLEEMPTISFQDQLNEIQAESNAARRMAGSNPAAQAMISAQAAAAKNKVLGEQLRTNQAMQAEARRRNLGVLNASTLKNLDILDQQYVRQSQAKSNTKAQAQTALSSIADKIAKNKLENRTFGVYENMYNYRFGPRGRAYNVNAPYEFNMEGNQASGGGGMPTLPEGYEYSTEIRKKKTKEDSRNGSIVKAIKNL